MNFEQVCFEMPARQQILVRHVKRGIEIQIIDDR